jgi:hypothetical protein
MTIEARYIFTVAMDVQPDKEALLEELYDNEHAPLLREVPGVLSVARFKREELTMIVEGREQRIVVEDEPRHSGIYEIESPDVLLSNAWAAAADAGRWPTDVRPFTSNRRPSLRRRMYPA